MDYMTAGESHGPQLVAIVSDVPAGIPLDASDINADLARRQSGYGRSKRQEIEHDVVCITSGVRFGKTLGTPVTFIVKNKDYSSWTDAMSVACERPAEVVREVCPRPGHADLSGVLKTGTDDCRDILERASARETAARVAAGGIAKAFLSAFGVSVNSYVTRIGRVTLEEPFIRDFESSFDPDLVESSPVRCPSSSLSHDMCQAIDEAAADGQSLGGCFKVVARGLVAGIGEYANPRRRLSSLLGGALFSIPGVKGVEIGGGFSLACLQGGDVHDEITYSKGSYRRTSNNAGGIEGGMTNGEPLVVSVAMKPLSTMRRPLMTVSIDTHEPALAFFERSDVCAVPACAVVAEAETAFVLAQAYLDKFGKDALDDIVNAYRAYRVRIEA